MSAFEIKILAELRVLREAEEALKATYDTLRASDSRGRRAHAGSFLASLRNLDERVNRLETFLERVA